MSPLIVAPMRDGIAIGNGTVIPYWSAVALTPTRSVSEELPSPAYLPIASIPTRSVSEGPFARVRPQHGNQLDRYHGGLSQLNAW